jgi:DNA repair exonuclease SbcCD ATPase subunit
MNTHVINDMSQFKRTVSRLHQNHHDLSSNIGNSAPKTKAKIENLREQLTGHYESLLQQEKQKIEFLQREIQNLRD